MSKTREMFRELFKFKYFIKGIQAEVENAVRMAAREMEGKYGWFDSTHKSYNLPEFWTGWVFKSSPLHSEFLGLK